MGQARLKKQSDPNYGKYSNKTRGIILSNPSTVGDNNFFSIKSSDLDHQDLRSSLLYWDRLSWPKNRMILIGNSFEVQELVNCGVMETPILPFRGSGPVADVMTAIEASALDYYEQSDPGTWSLAQGVNSLRHVGSAVKTGTGLEIYNALPVPSPDVPLVEILDFKERRHSELMMFRAHMDAMTKEITGSKDSSEALEKALRDLDEACANLIAVTKEWQFPVKLSNVRASVSFDFANSASAAAKAWKAAETMSLDQTSQLVAATVAGITSNFKISGDFNFQQIKRPSSPYKYLYQVTHELGS